MSVPYITAGYRRIYTFTSHFGRQIYLIIQLHEFWDADMAKIKFTPIRKVTVK